MLTVYASFSGLPHSHHLFPGCSVSIDRQHFELICNFRYLLVAFPLHHVSSCYFLSARSRVQSNKRFLQSMCDFAARGTNEQVLSGIEIKKKYIWGWVSGKAKLIMTGQVSLTNAALNKAEPLWTSRSGRPTLRFQTGLDNTLWLKAAYEHYRCLNASLAKPADHDSLWSAASP